jgi:hypothetical protein
MHAYIGFSPRQGKHLLAAGACVFPISERAAVALNTTF